MLIFIMRCMSFQLIEIPNFLSGRIWFSPDMTPWVSPQFKMNSGGLGHSKLAFLNAPPCSVWLIKLCAKLKVRLNVWAYNVKQWYGTLHLSTNVTILSDGGILVHNWPRPHSPVQEIVGRIFDTPNLLRCNVVREVRDYIVGALHYARKNAGCILMNVKRFSKEGFMNMWHLLFRTVWYCWGSINQNEILCCSSFPFLYILLVLEQLCES